jgi:hypothetical protein
VIFLDSLLPLLFTQEVILIGSATCSVAPPELTCVKLWLNGCTLSGSGLLLWLSPPYGGLVGSVLDLRR